MMTRIINWSRDHSITVLFVALIITCGFGYLAQNIRLDASADRMMNADDPEKEYYKKVVDTFGSDNVTVVYIKDKDIFTYDKLDKLYEAVSALEDIPGVTKVNSFFNTTNFKGIDGVLSTNKFIDEDIPEEVGDLQQIKIDALNNPVVLRRMISEKGNVIALNVVAFNETKEESFDVRMASDIEKAIGPLKENFEEVFQLGKPMMRKQVTDYMIGDQKLLIPLAVFVLLVLLIIGLKSFNGAALPVITGTISVIWTIGFMTTIDVPFQILTAIVPSLLLIMGATEDMHIISEYFEGIEEGKGRLGAIEYMGNKVGTAVFLTSMTTLLGFLSISVNNMVMLKEFGMAAAFGLFANFVITVTVCPAYLSKFGEKKSPFSSEENELKGFYQIVHGFVLDLVKRRPNLIFISAGVICLASVFGIMRIKVDNDLMGYFKPDSEIRIKSNIVQDNLAGSSNFYIVLESDLKNKFREPIYIKKLDEIQRYLKRTGHFDSSLSLANQISLINREFAGGGDKNFKIPDRKDLISQYLLFLTRDDLEQYVTADYKSANITVNHNLSSSFDLTNAVNEIKEEIPKILKGTGLSVKLISEGILLNRAADSMAKGQVESILMLLGIIFIMMCVLFTNVKAGALSLIPNIFPVFCLFGFMGLLDIPLNTGTALIAAIAIGIAVDDTVHFMVRYNSEFKKYNDRIKAIDHTLKSEIRPVFTTSIALAAGFLIVSTSNFVPIIHFGILASIVMICALIADILITPALLSKTQLVTIWDTLNLKIGEKVLENSPLFSNMSKFETKKVILLGKSDFFDNGVKIINQGEMDRRMYVLLEGRVKIERVDEDGHSHSLAELVEGEVFGEIALVNEVERTANIVVTSDKAHVLEIDWNSLNAMRKIHPIISGKLFLNISKILGRRLANVSEKNTKSMSLKQVG